MSQSLRAGTSIPASSLPQVLRLRKQRPGSTAGRGGSGSAALGEVWTPAASHIHKRWRDAHGPAMKTLSRWGIGNALLNQISRHLKIKGLIQPNFSVFWGQYFLLSFRGIDQAGQGTPDGWLATDDRLDTSPDVPPPPPALHV